MNIGARLRGGAMADSNLVARLRAVTANSLICREAADALAEQAETIQRLRHEFKNFHRLLCERFGYGHDEVDWQRDQLSLIEWIAKRPADDPASPVSR